MAQRRRNFIRQGKAEKVDVFVRTCVLKWQNRDCRLRRGNVDRRRGTLNPPDEKSGSQKRLSAKNGLLDRCTT